MSDIEIDGQYYQCGRLNARKQFHIARRLTPITKHLTPLFSRPPVLIGDGSGALVPRPAGVSWMDGLAAISATIAEMSDQEADYVIDGCLDAVRWRQGDHWMPLKTPGGALLLQRVADDLSLQLRLTWEVLVENLGNFSLGTLLPMLVPATNGLDTTATAQL